MHREHSRSVTTYSMWCYGSQACHLDPVIVRKANTSSLDLRSSQVLRQMPLFRCAIAPADSRCIDTGAPKKLQLAGSGRYRYLGERTDASGDAGDSRARDSEVSNRATFRDLPPGPPLGTGMESREPRTVGVPHGAHRPHS